MKTTLLNLLARCLPSKIILNNCIELIQREQVGLKKYGVSLTDAPITHEQALQHLLEEQLDAANYTRKALMTASHAHLDYSLLRRELEQAIDATGNLKPRGLDLDHEPADAYHIGVEDVRERLKAMLLQFDCAKIRRDLAT